MRLTKALKTNRKSHTVEAPRGRPFTFPAPTRGWNARDPLGGMKPSDAIILDNYRPTTADVQLRSGSEPWATGMGAGNAVESLMEYNTGTDQELWAACNGKIFDVTAQAAVGAAAVSGQSSNRWQHIIFQTSSAVARLMLVNGVDKMQQYDGTTWATIDGVSVPIAITGIATTSLINIWEHQNRVFFIEKNSMNAWYLAPDSYGGAATKLPLGGLFRDGGYLIAGGTWTRDGGNGMDDLCIFLTSQGEVAIFAGNDPSDPDHWSEIGRYVIGAPIGYRCLIKTGADLAVICLDGIVGLSNIISLDRASSNKVALSDRIRGAFNEAAQLYRNNFGWDAVSYPRGSQVWFNIPVDEGTTQHQYVLYTPTGAWCRYKGMNGNCFHLFNERMYFGNNDGEVWLADEGDSDNDVEIEGLIKTAFNYQNSIATKKNWKLAKPILYSDVSLTYGLVLAVDFDLSTLAPSVVPGDGSGATWNISPWDTTPWSTLVALKSWRKINGTGTCASIIFKTNTKGMPITLNSIDVLYEPGGIL